MLKNRSVATIDKPEFINIEPYNPLISQCEIKVFYLGENRNKSFIDKNTAIQMANSLPGTPIVAAFIEDKDDFGDHGHVIKIEDGEVKFSCKTQPYGFVAPDAQVWFQKFIDTNEMGEQIEREYLMTTGYLWSGQYPEIQKAIEQGQPHSMELDENTMDGHWAANNSGVEFFIINDATFSKLCILGDDVEPCFEGSAVTAPEVSKRFSKDPAFANTLFTMMEELKTMLKGGSDMPKFEQEVEPTAEVAEETLFSAEEHADEPATEEFKEAISVKKGKDDEMEYPEKEKKPLEKKRSGVPMKAAEAAKDPEEDEEKKPLEKKRKGVPMKVAESAKDSEEDEDFKKKQGCCSLDESEGYSLDEVEAKFAALEAELESLRAFKLEVENQQKDALIAKYFMLSEQDKADVIEHKEEYSLEEIEAKLAVAYVKANVNFESLGEETETEEAETPVSTFSLDNETEGVEFVSALQERLRMTRN